MPTAPLHVFGANKLIPFYHPQDANVVHYKVANGLTLAAGTLVGEQTANPGQVIAYLTGAVDGSQNPIGVLQYDVVTDGSGNHTWGGSSFGETFKSAPVYVSGYFKTTDLVGLDAGAVTKFGRMVHGSISDGVIAIHGS